MSETTPEPGSDDDIPTLTDIVVPGRLPGAPASDAEAPPEAAEPDFVFDIDFDRLERTPAAAEATPDDEADLPLPWVPDADEAQQEQAPAEPVDIIATVPAAVLDPQRLHGVREHLLARLEQHLHDELARTEARLRARLRAELDRILADPAGPSSTL